MFQDTKIQNYGGNRINRYLDSPKYEWYIQVLYNSFDIISPTSVVPNHRLCDHIIFHFKLTCLQCSRIGKPKSKITCKTVTTHIPNVVKLGLVDKEKMQSTTLQYRSFISQIPKRFNETLLTNSNMH